MKTKIIYYSAIFACTLSLAMFFTTAFCQVPVVNTNTAIKAEAGTTLFINGSLTQQTIATIDNAGIINLTGDFTNNTTNNCFGPSGGNGLVTLTGGVQNIGGTGITAFNNLTLAGTGTKVLTQDIIAGGINGVINLGNRILDLNSNNLTVSNQFPTAFSRLTGFIQSETDAAAGYGSINWRIDLPLTGSNFEFPFGNASTNSYLPFNFQVVSPGVLSTKGSVSVATYPTITSAAPNNRSLPTGVAHLNNALNADNSHHVLDRYWVMDVTGYATAPTANMSMTYRSSEHDVSGGSTNIINEAFLAAQRWDGIQWLAQTGSVDVINNKVTVTNANSFNNVWTLVSSSSPLPVELLNFDAKLNKDSKVDLNWATATEINNDYFTMERSADGINFESLGNVDGAGNSSAPIAYSGLDGSPYSGVSYYRLKQTDFDGRFTYSRIVPIEIKNTKPALAINFSIYPNPSTDHAFIQIQGVEANQQVVMEVFNAIGQLVVKSKLADLIAGGSNAYRFNTASFPAGYYLVRLSNGAEIFGSQKLIVN